MAGPTPGAANGAPRVGPIVINELMYYPPGFAYEYLELRNLTGADVLLNDPAAPGSAYKFAGDFAYTFPVGAHVPAFGFALLVPTDEATFRTLYDVPPGVPVYTYAGTDFSNTGENLTLYRQTPAGDMLVDRLNYTSTVPWPAGALESGSSIARLDSGQYGNDAGNWRLEVNAGTPGRLNLDTAGPTFDIVDVTPDPRTTPVGSITIVFSEPVRGFELSDVRLTRDGGANLLTAAQSLTSTDLVTWTLSGLTGITGAAGSYTVTVNGAAAGITDWAANATSTSASDTWRVGGAPTGRVVGRHVFYNGSAFDGANGAANAQDDGAVAIDKAALLPGQAAAFANYTSYSRGINGVMVDVSGLLADLTAADFTFKVGNDADPGAWTDAPAPLSVTRRNGAGVNGSDRITLVWAHGAIRNTWLRVTVLANGRTALAQPDVFYFGNLVGEVGDSTTGAVVTAADVLAVRNAMSAAAAGITNAADFNRDGRINTLDLLMVRAALANGSLTLLTAPSAPAIAAASGPVTASSAEVVPTSTQARARPARRGSLLTADTDLLGRGA
jgi:hypothetical protein